MTHDMKTFPTPLLAKSPGARLEQLLDLYAPMVEREDGTRERDPSLGVISREDFVRLLDMPE